MLFLPEDEDLIGYKDTDTDQYNKTPSWIYGAAGETGWGRENGTLDGRVGGHVKSEGKERREG